MPQNKTSRLEIEKVHWEEGTGPLPDTIHPPSRE